MKTALKIGALAASLLCAAARTASAAPVKNILLVHGAFVDGSGWRPVYDILVRDGYNVSVVQHPLTGLDEDVAATKRPGPAGWALHPRRSQLWRGRDHRGGRRPARGRPRLHRRPCAGRGRNRDGERQRYPARLARTHSLGGSIA